jgi:hypothetical protein
VLKKYVRVNILLPIKPETRKAFGDIVHKLSSDFGGVTYSKPHIPSEINGMWIDPVAGKVINEHHISLLIDADPANGINITSYFSRLKRDLEHKLNENMIWILFMDAARVA